jgi:hypothetical protein
MLCTHSLSDGRLRSSPDRGQGCLTERQAERAVADTARDDSGEFSLNTLGCEADDEGCMPISLGALPARIET